MWKKCSKYETTRGARRCKIVIDAFAARLTRQCRVPEIWRLALTSARSWIAFKEWCPLARQGTRAAACGVVEADFFLFDFKWILLCQSQSQINLYILTTSVYIIVNVRRVWLTFITISRFRIPRVRINALANVIWTAGKVSNLRTLNGLRLTVYNATLSSFEANWIWFEFNKIYFFAKLKI